MPKKRTPRQRKAAAGRAQQERRRAGEASRRDEHARLVAERHGDPRFVQRRTTDDGAVISWEAGTPADRDIRQAVEIQVGLFREKFGRDPAPDDLLFFDPDADEPAPLSKEKWDTQLTEMADRAAEVGIDAAFVHAWRDVGYVITSDNQHMFSAAEVQAYEDAVLRHRGLDPDDDDGWYDEDDGAESADGDLVPATADGLEQVVALTMRDCDPLPARRLADALLSEENGEEEAGLVFSLTLGILMGWLVGAREYGVEPVAAIDWISDHIGEDEAAAAQQVGGIVGHPLSPTLTVSDANDRLGSAFIPTLIWLCAGVAAAAGLGDAHWLRQFDPGA